jgi:hypothetical protein
MSVTRVTSAELKRRTDDAVEPISSYAAPKSVVRGGRISGMKGGSARGAASDLPTEMKPAPRFAFSVSGISQG